MKFTIPPNQAGYAHGDPVDTIRVQLDGGAGRYRKDVTGSTRIVNCSWTLSPAGFEYFRSFYRVITEQGSLPFTIDLILDYHAMLEHTARFVPGSVDMQSVNGLTYMCKAQLEVTPIDPDVALETDKVELYNELGDTWQVLFESVEDLFNKIINVDLPFDFGLT